MRTQILAAAFTLLCSAATADEIKETAKDTSRVYEVDGVVVRASTKETTSALMIPSAATNIGVQRIEALNIDNIKNISTLAPNLFITDYGSPLTTPIYIRGVGTRGSGQSVAIYIDGVPLLDKSVFDMERLGISHIEVLRGPQGTLYGRNAMGGVINIQTKSPLDYQGTKIRAGVASYDTYNLDATTNFKLTDNFGIGISAYGNSTQGYFLNTYTGKRVDARKNAGGSLRLDWRFAQNWRAELSGGFDYSGGGAFAYGLYDKATGSIADVAYNDRGTYDRRSSNNSLRLSRNGEKVLFSSTTSYQWLSDDMWMDQDFTPQSIFTINQRQKQNAVSQELTWRSATLDNYQWSAGAFGFYSGMTTVGDVTFGSDGIAQVLQPVFDKISQGAPGAPTMTIIDEVIPNPGTYKTPTWGAAVFHQSTFNNLFTEGLSLTLGIRFDYERQYLDYNTSIEMNIAAKMPFPPFPTRDIKADTTLMGGAQQSSFEWLPKASLRYECGGNASSWITVSKGYKAGGYNVQMFSEVIQGALQEKYNPKATPSDLQSTISYKPEITWNYEIGTRVDLFDRAWSLEAVLFYMDISNVQVTRFVDGGSGRVLSNAARGSSYGAEFATTIRPLRNRRALRFDVNYGYNHATFTQYDGGKDREGNTVDYSGKFIPYTPSHTFNASGIYNLGLSSNFLRNIEFVVSYNGAGKIYWNEANDVAQNFYGLVDAKVGFHTKYVNLELWAKNIFDTRYGAFYFESFSKSFIQQGRPMTFGVDLIFKF